MTDRCNLRCTYCMPEENYQWFPQADVLRFEEASRLVDIFARLGVDKLRITGGEPLLRCDLDKLIEILAAKSAIKDLALTTNAVRLKSLLPPLAQAGLGRITVSLDTLRPDRFQSLTRRDDLHRVLDSIHAVGDEGMAAGFKIDTVLMRGVNDDEIFDLLDFSAEVGAEIRFIEYMDVGGATTWTMDKVLSQTELVSRLVQEYGDIEKLAKADSAPASRYRLPDGRIFGIIASTTAPFCGTCDRSRLTADGKWFLCLYARDGVDLKTPLRAGASDDDLIAMITNAWGKRLDRGAEDRLALKNRAAAADADELRNDPHFEMHTRGG